MKRVEASYSEETLVELLNKNPLGRNQDLKAFISILENIEGGYSFFLDAEWGTGKTVFVKQLKILLDLMNPNLEADESLRSSVLSDSKFTTKEAPLSILPIYYNAWENDYWSDPLPSILGTIVAQFDLPCKVKADTQTSEKIVEAVNVLLTLANCPTISKLHDAFTGEDLTKAYKDRDKLRNSLSEMIETISLERANTVLLIIDELDRCRPTFAIRLLEEVKNLFNSDKLVILYATNCNQLKYTVAGVYGAGFDGERYLSRFYDTKILLRKASSIDYLRHLGLPQTSDYYDKISAEIPGAYKMELRECEKFYIEIERARPIVTNHQQDSYLFSFVGTCIVPFMLALKILDSERFETIRKNSDYELLLEDLIRTPTSLTYLGYAIKGTLEDSSSEDASKSELEARRKTFLKHVVNLLWNSDRASTEYSQAYEALLSGHSFTSGRAALKRLEVINSTLEIPIDAGSK